MGQSRALGQGDATGLNHATAYVDLNELGAEVGLAGLQQLLAQHDIALADADDIAVKEADVLGFIPIGDQGDEVELGADVPATGREGLLTRHLNRGQVGIGRDACAVWMASKTVGKSVALLTTAAPCQTFLVMETN